MPNMKQADLKPCSKCGEGVMHTGNPMFYRVTVDSLIVDPRAVQRQHGLEMMLGGNAAIAHAMGPQEDMAKQIDSNELILCMDCMLSANVAMLLPGD